jgi:Tol biopolymer transport system component
MTRDSGRWRRIETLCAQALEQPPADRDAFLASACGSDDDLRREVATLLAHEPAAEHFLAQSVGAVAAGVLGVAARQLSVGGRVGPYDIVGHLGAGGMGEVYRARDAKLGREVAIKVLPRAMSGDRDRLARFEREARVLASLNHPHIGAIYGIEECDGQPALILELVDGETLAGMLQRRAGRRLAVADALGIARQIAEALEAAHDKGIVHRDLKPANIKIGAGGAVKVLDFGIAKPLAATIGPDVSPPSSVGDTQTGVLLGTAAYMSPEQARGLAVDARTDVWAFGCVLYEMLTGRVTFDGATASDCLAAILERPPDWRALPVDLPPSIARLLHRCLEKDPRRRLHAIADARLEIDDALSVPPGAPAQPTSRRIAPRLTRLTIVLVAIAAVAVGWRLSFTASVAARRPVARFVVQGTPAAPIRTGAFDVSPDGSAIVYVGIDRAPASSTGRLFLRRIDQFDATALPGSEGADLPFFSPDGQWVAYVAGDVLHKLNVRTMAAPVVLCPVGDVRGGFTWPTDAWIYFANAGQGLQRVSAEGGQPMPVTALTDGDLDHHTARLLPDGDTLLFAVREAAGGPMRPNVREPVTSYSPATQQFKIVAQSQSTRRRKTLIAAGFDPHYVKSGHIVYASDDAILAVPFDVRGLEVVGAPVTLVEHVATVPQNGNGGFRLSDTGSLLFEPAQSTARRMLTWVTRSGAETLLPIAPRSFTTPRLSPDGRRLAFAVAEGARQDIWVYNVASEVLTRATRDGVNLAPMWTRDGARLTYASNRGGVEYMIWQPSDGTGVPETLMTGRNMLWPNSWTAGNRALVYVDAPATDDYRIFTLALDSAGRPLPPQLHAPRKEWLSFLSPDDRWIALTSSETGRSEVYVEDYPSGREHHQVSADGGSKALWSRDGRELFYRRGDAVFAVPIDTRHGFIAGKPLLLFRGRFVSNVIDYDVAPDGRFLMMKPDEDELAPPALHVVLNWADELATRVVPSK